MSYLALLRDLGQKKRPVNDLTPKVMKTAVISIEYCAASRASSREHAKKDRLVPGAT